MTEFRVAIVGAGAMAREHARAFQDIKGVQIAGIWNRTRSKAEGVAQELGIPVVATDIADLKQRTQADLAVVAVYETAIYEVITEVLKHPWSILMEKPVGLDLAQADAIFSQSRTNRRDVYVALNRRAMSSTQSALSDLRSNEGPRFIHVQDQQDLNVARNLGHADPVVRNWMYANSIHLVDYLCAFGRGEVVDVTTIVPWTSEKPGVVLARVTFESGDIGLYEGLWNGPGPWACTVSTPNRRWEMRPLEKAVYQNAGERTLNPVEPHVWDTKFKPGFRKQAQDVVSAIRGQGGAVTLDEAMRTTQLISRIFAVGQ